METATSASNSNNKTQGVSCQGSKVAIGGGWTASLADGTLNASSSQPTGGSASTPPTGWSATVNEIVVVVANWTVTVYVVCATTVS